MDVFHNLFKITTLDEDFSTKPPEWQEAYTKGDRLPETEKQLYRWRKFKKAAKTENRTKNQKLPKA